MTTASHGETGPVVDVGEVRLALQQILASPAFRQSARMSRFLSHAVEATLAGDTTRLKEVCVGMAVFDRPAGYNPKLDPVVRNEARRLRGKLEQYYAAEGSADTLRISIPRGAYVASFETVSAAVAVEFEELPKPVDWAGREAPAIPKAGLKWGRAVLLAAAAISLGALGSARLNRPSIHGFTGARFSYLTSLPTREIQPSISPDGQKVIYSSDQNGKYNIYVTTLDGQTTRLTHADAHELHPAWSPDGQLFAFLRISDDGFDVVVSPLAGGAERKVARIEHLGVAAPHDDVLLAQGSPGPAWSPAGTELAFTYGIPETSSGPIHVLQLNSGQQRVLTHPANGAYDFYPAYSPDGKWLAFCRLHSNSTSSIYVVPASGGAERPVSKEDQDLRGLAWMPDGRFLILSSNRAGTQRLWSVGLDNGRMSPFPTAGTSARDPSVSRDGKWVVYSDYMLQAEIWKLPLKGAPGRNLLPSTRQDHSAQYSPDGKSIAFVSDRSGSWELWTVLADGTGPRQLTHFDGPLLGTPHWSPDGRYLAFDARPKGHSAIFVIPALGGTPRVVDDNSQEDKMPCWSHDGKWIYFNSNRGGSQQLWKIPAAGGKAILLARQFAMDSVESPDGRNVYFLGASPGIWQAPVEGGKAAPVKNLGGGALESRRMFSVTSEGIWFLGQAKGNYGVWLYNLASGQVKYKAALENDVMLDVPGLSVSPDGSNLLYSRRKESRSDLMLVRSLERQ